MSKKTNKSSQAAQNCTGTSGKNCTGTSGKNSTDTEAVRQSSNYDIHDKPLPDNNMFYEERQNPLSSKGN